MKDYFADYPYIVVFPKDMRAGIMGRPHDLDRFVFVEDENLIEL